MADRRSVIPNRGDDLVGTCRGLGRGGDGVVETSRGVVFVPFVLPGEEVAIGDVARGGKVLRGTLRRVITASPARVTAPCPYVEGCGGCPMMMLELSAQRAHKLSQVARATGVEPTLHAGGSALGYRQRARFAFERKRRSTLLGFRAMRSNRVLNIDRCVVLDAAVQRGLDFAHEVLAPHLDGAGEIWVAHGASGLPVLWLETSTMQSGQVYHALQDAVPRGELAGAALRIGGAGQAELGVVEEHGIGFDEAPLVGPAFGFSQAHGVLNGELVALVAALAGVAGKRVLELYSGAGNLSVALAREALALTVVESSGDAVAACDKNLAARGLAARSIVANAAEATARATNIDVIVLDPPRAGARDAIAPVLACKPERIVYVSCDPPTLARDVAMLVAGGFRVEEAHVLDMFPHTAHVEAVVALIPA